LDINDTCELQLKYQVDKSFRFKIILYSLKYKINWVTIFMKTHKIIGIIFDIDSTFFNCNISNIIITNKNSIAIAPTYTIINIKGIKLNPNNINKPEVFKNSNTNQKTE
jgi:hypothetical protein